MISGRATRTPNHAARNFVEWASLFSERMFVQIVVYADETLRPKDSKLGNKYLGSIGMAGFIATAHYWKGEFSKEWQRTLDKHHAKYFHFRELNPAFRKNPGTTYSGWSNDEVDDFIHDLAKLAGRVAVPFGSNVFLAAPEHENYRPDNWKQTCDMFFDHFLQIMDLHWPHFREPVAFFFDRQKNSKIVAQLNDSIHEYQDKDPRIGSHAFAGPGMKEAPLQAADMLAFALGQIAERAFIFQKRQHNRILDLALFKNQYPRGHPYRLPWGINDDAFESLIDDFRAHKKIWDAQRKKAGLPKTEYFPAIHYSNENPR
jgi:hypothetical protein